MRRRLVRGVSVLTFAAVLLLASLAASGSASTSASGPSNTVPPTISGQAVAGAVLTASTGTWSGDAPISFAFQWRICDTRGTGCADVTGAEGQTYSVTAADVGHTLRVGVTASNSAGTGNALSASTETIATATAPTNTSLPTISGGTRQGSTLSTSDGSWSGSPSPTFSYGWLRCNTSGGTCTAITGQNSRTYGLGAADVGATIRSVVTASNSAGAATVESNPTVTVSALGDAPRPSSQPDISGTLQIGHTLTAGTGKPWTGSSPITYSFSWQRCDTAGRCSTIAGATAQTHVATEADVGFRLRALVVGTNAYGSGSVTTNLTAGPIQGTGPKPALASAPAVSGTPEVGSTLQTTAGTWRNTSSGLRLSYSWLRCDTRGGACSSIAGATSSSYTLGVADAGHTIRSQVTATVAAGSTSATSAASSVIGTLPPGAVKLTGGGVSVPVQNVSLPQRLVIQGVSFSPAHLTSRAPFVARFKVVDSNGDAVRDALVYVLALPYGELRPAPETRTDVNGIATITLGPTASLHLRNGAIVMFVRARKDGGSLLGGISTRRLVQIRVVGR
jgi:hypothetical protein